MDKIFTFAFDIHTAEKLRSAVNEKQNLSLEKTHEIGSTHTKYLAWERMCAILDRLEDTLEYLNSMELGHCRSTRSAFDFYEFINNAYVVIDCIETMAKIFAVKKDEIAKIEMSQECFGDVLNVGGTDSQFFSYIRSLCVVHPINTTGTKNNSHPYMRGDDLHCCPYVIWAGTSMAAFYQDNRDLTARIYNSKNDREYHYIPLYVNQFEAYINKWINLIPKVIEAIKVYNDKAYDDFRREKIKKYEEYKNPIDCFEILRDLYIKRFGTERNYVFDTFIEMFQAHLTDEGNKQKFEKYKNAIIYAIPFFIEGLQTMSFEGFENSGVKYSDNCGDQSLLFYLENCSCDKGDFQKYSYHIGKLYQLKSPDFQDKMFVRKLLDEMKPLLNRYIHFTNEETDEETLILVNLALYLNALETKCMLNKNIPNDLNYREKLLTGEQLAELYSPDKKIESMNFVPQEFHFILEDGTVDVIKIPNKAKE